MNSSQEAELRSAGGVGRQRRRRGTRPDWGRPKRKASNTLKNTYIYILTDERTTLCSTGGTRWTTFVSSILIIRWVTKQTTYQSNIVFGSVSALAL